MKITDKMFAHVSANPVTWLLLGLFLFAEYSNYQKGVKLDQVCDVFPMPAAIHVHPRTDQERAEAICDERRNPTDNDISD